MPDFGRFEPVVIKSVTNGFRHQTFVQGRLDLLTHRQRRCSARLSSIGTRIERVF